MNSELPTWARSLRRAIGESPSAFGNEVRVSGLSRSASMRLSGLFPSNPTKAAVLILLTESSKDSPDVIVTRKANNLSRHSGDLCFPGGYSEPGDSSPIHTALREVREEIGIPISPLLVLGVLPNHMLIKSNCLVTPVVAFSSEALAFRPNESEVSAVFSVPLRALMDRRCWTPRMRQLDTFTFRVYDIRTNYGSISGATAGMVVTLYRLMSAVQPMTSASEEISKGELQTCQ